VAIRGPSRPLDVVKIAHPCNAGDYVIINAADYDSSRHTLFGDSIEGFRRHFEEETERPQVAEAPKKKRGRPPKIRTITDGGDPS
jgi:hypothetical protein